jgi:type II secretory ATPase GspE/PulE/Tfp pilus assembly ATPase PilB-like protein
MPIDVNKQQSKRIQDIRHREEEAFTMRVAQNFKLPYIDLTQTNIETDALVLVPEEEARAASAAPFKLVGSDLYIGVKSPELPETKALLRKLEKNYTLGVHMVSTRSLERAWSRYDDVSYTRLSQGGMLDISSDGVDKVAKETKSYADIAQLVTNILESSSSKKTSQLMEVVFGGAIATGSSDVHIEAQEKQARLRFRQDGVLQDITSLDHASYQKVLSRIKLLSEMKLTQTENAQDGRFTIDFNDKKIEVRTSVIPSAYGESLVMRILNPDNIHVGVEQLGIEPHLFQVLLREIKKPNGMILTTGPTGSGKTTTLYSFLRKVYNPEVKILTIEDPIEYHLKGISQTQVDRAKGYTFNSGLRAALRQDPDIVMVGEIRDKETATTAVNASLTGHLVLSTLHTNSAAGVIPRLLDLGVSPQILAAALSVSLAQRLVRRVCEHCKEEIEPTPEEEKTIRDILNEAVRNNKPIHEYGLRADQSIRLVRGRGCEHCHGTGYKGRIGIFEAIITDETIEELLNKKPSEQELRRVAEKQGFLNMREDGIVKVLNQVTTLEEVRSVVDLDVDPITDSQKDELQEPQNQQEEILTHNSPSEFLGDQSMEVSLLVDYLKRLEHEQRINPEINAGPRIELLENTILDMMKRIDLDDIIADKNNHSYHKVQRAYDDLASVRSEQTRFPQANAAKRIRSIRQDLEGAQ